jgi:hypothetical protein
MKRDDERGGTRGSADAGRGSRRSEPSGARWGGAPSGRGARPTSRVDDERAAARRDHLARQADLARRTDEIARSTGLPSELARRVALGQADTNTLLAELAFRDQVDALMQRHDLIRALATQVALGHARIEDVLLRRRVDALLASGRDRSTLDEACVSGAELTLGLHGQRTVRARVTKVDRYEVELVDAATGAPERVHKLRVKYAHAPDEGKRLRKALDYDKTRRDREIEPIARPQERFACSDRRLGTLADARAVVTAVTLEGECFTGEIAWVGRYEFGLRTRTGAELVFFRHALDDLRVAGASDGGKGPQRPRKPAPTAPRG